MVATYLLIMQTLILATGCPAKNCLQKKQKLLPNKKAIIRTIQNPFSRFYEETKLFLSRGAKRAWVQDISTVVMRSRD